MTWDCVDWRTYTTAFRLRTAAGISSALVIVKLLDAEARRLHQDLSQYRDDFVSLRGDSILPSLLASNSRFICRPAIADGNLRELIAILPNDCGIARECVVSAAPINSRFNSSKCRQIHARRAHRSSRRTRQDRASSQRW